MSGTVLRTRLVRELTLAATDHPRGQPHLSSASGLVCVQGRAYVVADDEHHLAVFDDLASPGRLIRLFPGDLPAPKKARKKEKPDTEALMRWPAGDRWPHGALLALGSGSRPNRQAAVLIGLDAAGEPTPAMHRLDLAPLYAPLAGRIAQLNIEGAMVLGREFVLLQRGNKGGSANAVIRWPLDDVAAWVAGAQHAPLTPIGMQVVDLGTVNGVPLCFTDGAALPDGRWVFSAAAENTDDSYADGACAGSALGLMEASGRVAALHPLPGHEKVEGVDVRVAGGRIDVCLVTDADDPQRASRLLLTQLPQ